MRNITLLACECRKGRMETGRTRCWTLYASEEQHVVTYRTNLVLEHQGRQHGPSSYHLCLYLISVRSSFSCPVTYRWTLFTCYPSLVCIKKLFLSLSVSACLFLSLCLCLCLSVSLSLCVRACSCFFFFLLSVLHLLASLMFIHLLRAFHPKTIVKYPVGIQEPIWH